MYMWKLRALIEPVKDYPIWQMLNASTRPPNFAPPNFADPPTLRCLWGAGHINFNEQLNALKRAGYGDTITLEVFSEDKYYLEYSRDQLRKLWSDAWVNYFGMLFADSVGECESRRKYG
jgi:hypothetical protein